MARVPADPGDRRGISSSELPCGRGSLAVVGRFAVVEERWTDVDEI